MAKQPKQPDNRKTLSECRKQLRADDAVMAKSIIRFFKAIAAANPQAVIDAMNARGTYLSTIDAERQANMVTFYADNCDYLIELFDLK